MSEALFTELDGIFDSYRQELEACARKQSPAAGLFGVGHSIKDDACHDRFDERIRQFVSDAASRVSSGEARQIIRRLYTEADLREYPLSAKWMMIAAERHILLLIPVLGGSDAAELAGHPGNYVVGANIAGFKKVADAMLAQGIV